ncbi:conserved hypothetical protein [Ricinus communis]|uniref:Uncharacterized protein n=1 Tax=Ricinus communis TaxID=3988 RepID=B9R6Z0_RICCO|nr:conserved hypothetical protein [Ricinus communis]
MPMLVRPDLASIVKEVQRHLRKDMGKKRHTPLLKPKSYADNLQVEGLGGR